MPARLDFSTPHVLRNEDEYAAAHAEVIALLDQHPAPASEAGERLEFLTVLIAAYDDAHSTIGREPATPQEVVDFALAQRGESRASLHDLLGGKSRVSEFFSRKRSLSIAQVQAIRLHYGLPADVLIPAAPVSTARPDAAARGGRGTTRVREGRGATAGAGKTSQPTAKQASARKEPVSKSGTRPAR